MIISNALFIPIWSAKVLSEMLFSKPRWNLAWSYRDHRATKITITRSRSIPQLYRERVGIKAWQRMLWPFKERANAPNWAHKPASVFLQLSASSLFLSFPRHANQVKEAKRRSGKKRTQIQIVAKEWAASCAAGGVRRASRIIASMMDISIGGTFEQGCWRTLVSAAAVGVTAAATAERRWRRRWRGWRWQRRRRGTALCTTAPQPDQFARGAGLARTETATSVVRHIPSLMALPAGVFDVYFFTVLRVCERVLTPLAQI